MFDVLLAIIVLGFLVGIKHALEADHIAAVSAIATKSRNAKAGWKIGIVWGLGHTFTLAVLGAAILFFKITLPANIALGFELVVGIVLVILGLDILRKFFANQHIHVHGHSIQKHAHYHAHEDSKSHNHMHSFALGMLHGLAGTAALVLLVLASVGSFAEGMLYILSFGIGSILGMGLVTLGISVPFIFTNRFDNSLGKINAAAGLLSIIVGILIVYEIVRVFI